MSDSVNPYQGPEAAPVPVDPPGSQGTLTEVMVNYLKGASPWLRFIGILGFVFSGLTAFWGVAMLALSPFMDKSFESLPGYEQWNFIFQAAFGGTMLILCVIGAVFIFIPSLFIYRFGEKIRSFLRNGSGQELEQAFKNNKSLWKFLGILSIVELAFIPVLIIVGIVTAVVVALA
jgi:hypothetical protein